MSILWKCLHPAASSAELDSLLLEICVKEPTNLGADANLLVPLWMGSDVLLLEIGLKNCLLIVTYP